MKIAIMQPYLFPYIGYFQLINSVDTFVIYDDIQYTKKGWINRNRILANGKDVYISVPLKKDSDYLNVNQRELSLSWEDDKKKLLNKIKASYQKAPFFKTVFPLIENCLNFKDPNLFNFIYHSLQIFCKELDIHTKFVISSTLEIDENLKSAEKVKAICKKMNADYYLNPIGGRELYKKEDFKENNISLNFLQTENKTYKQFENEFIPFLSIVDVMMFNGREVAKNRIDNEYKIV